MPLNEVGKDIEDTLTTKTTRYHALDCVRATAMFLGVFYHLQFMSAGGFGMFGMGGSNPKASIDAWLHSFRMPLFFLISGFFASMMLQKYGLWKYLSRRWWRIGAPLLVAFVCLGLLRTYFPKIVSPAFGGFNLAAATNAAPRNPFTPGQMGATNGAFYGGGFGQPGQFGMNPFGGGQPMQGFGMAGQAGFGMAAMPAMALPVVPSHKWADAILEGLNKAQDWLFAKAPWLSKALVAVGGQKGRLVSGNFNFEHLWFLWYLLVFVTAAPLLIIPTGKLVNSHANLLDNVGRTLVRFNVAGLALGVLALPAVLHARGATWTTENPVGFMAVLPDCFVQYFSDLPLYFLSFLAGWWFFRFRDSLPFIAKFWLWNLALGIAGFALSQSLYTNHGLQTNAPDYAHYRLFGFAIYTLGAVYSGLGLLGLFQRYLDRPTKAGKYFTDTMLWIYLVQIAIIPHVLPWIQSDRTAWWEATIAGMVVVTVIALAMFELFIRPTPLVHIFGPASLGRKEKRTQPAREPVSNQLTTAG